MRQLLRRFSLALGLPCCFLGAVCCVLSAHETDPFAVPVGKEYVDLGDLWNRLMHEAVRKSAEEINQKIRRAQAGPDARRHLQRLRSVDHLASTVRWQFPAGLLMIEEIEAALHSEKEKCKHGGKIVAYRSPVDDATYTHNAFFPDPRILGRVLLIRSSTIKMHGAYFGTDKFGHLIGWGHLYFLKYRLSRSLGMSHRDAMLNATKIGKTNPVGEIFLHGVLPTGVYSNADLAANYVGLKFYVNLTEPVILRGKRVEPMLKLENGLWKLQPHVRPDAEHFALFLSHHFNEALNPCWYDWIMRSQVRGYVKKNRQRLIDWYAGRDPQKRTRAYFDQQWKDLTHYYGEDYGHSGDYNSLVTLGNTCFEGGNNIAPPRKPVLARWPHVSRDVVPAAKTPRDQTAGAGYTLALKAVGPTSIPLQREVEYGFAVRNCGAQTAKNVEVRLTVGKGLQITKINKPAQFDPQHNRLHWRIDEIPAGGEKTLRLKAGAIHVGRHVQTIEIRRGAKWVASRSFATDVKGRLKR